MDQMCPCGKPLHYSLPHLKMLVEELIEQLGPCVKVTAERRSWMVPRHYLALHGLRASELPGLGFEEVSN